MAPVHGFQNIVGGANSTCSVKAAITLLWGPPMTPGKFDNWWLPSLHAGSLITVSESAPLVLTGSALSPLAKMVLLILSACSERAGRGMAHWYLGR